MSLFVACLRTCHSSSHDYKDFHKMGEMSKPEPTPDLSRLHIERHENVSSASGWSLKRVAAIAAATIALLIFVSWISGTSESDSSISNESVIQPNSEPVVLSGSSLSASGYVVAQRQAAVASKATGRLKTLYVEEGDVVKAQQVLAELESDDLSALLREVEANLLVLAAGIKSSEAELVDSQRDFERLKNLKRSNSISQSDLDRAETRYQKAVANLELSKANYSAAQAKVERTRVELGYTKIVAPFDGTVLTKTADIGEIVAPFGSSSNARAAVVTIADMSSLEVEADVSEANITKVFVGQECSVVLDSYPDRPYKGRVHKIVPTVDRAKATVLTKIQFLDRDERVLPEMSAKITFHLKHN